MNMFRLFRDESGQTTIMMMMSIVCLCGMAGFAVDVGTLFRDKRVLQTAADAGAIAGAAEYKYGIANAKAAAKAASAQNGITDGVNGVVVTVNTPPTSGLHTGAPGAVEVIVTQNAPTYFMKLFHLSSMMVGARAVAGLGPASGCIYTLDTSGVDIGMTGTADLYMPDCGIVVNSGSNDAIDLVGGAKITADSVGVVGGVSGNAKANISPTPVTGIAPAYNPLSWLSAPSFNAASCLADPHITGSGSATIGPALAGGTVCYNGLTITGSGSLTMNPGVYIINGGFSQAGSSSISGSGVTVYLAAPNGSLTLTGSGALNLSAPTDVNNPYNGILFFEDPSDTNQMKISGSGSSVLQGIFYAPAAQLTLTGSSGSKVYADLVVSSLSMVGSTTFSNYSSINLNEPLTTSSLTE